MGFLDNAGVDRVWKKFKEQLSNYLPLTGGTMKGLLTVPYGTAVHYSYGTNGSDGYVRLATIVIKAVYTDAPIELTITRRLDSQPTNIVVQFNGTNSNDPTIETFSVFGATTDVWIYKSAVSTWELYVKKSGPWDEVDVTEYHNPTYNNITVTWQKDMVSTLPEGAGRATVGEFLGVASKSAGIVDYNDEDGTVKIGYAGNSLGSSELLYLAGYAAGGKIKDASKDAVKNYLGISDYATHTHGEATLTWGGKNLSGDVGPVGASLSAEHSANRLAFINGDALTIEYSKDGGTTWNDYGLTANKKSWLCTDYQEIPIGRIDRSEKYTTDSKTRITIFAQPYFYTNPKKLLVNMSVSGKTKLLIECKKGTENAEWESYSTTDVSGWSGWNDVDLQLPNLGGYTHQQNQYWYLRLTFSMKSVYEDYAKTAYVLGLRLFGTNNWGSASEIAGKGKLSSTGHVYSYDADANVTFPAVLAATTLREGDVNLWAKYQPRGTLTLMHGNECRFDKPSWDAARELWFGYAWSDGTKEALITRYIFGNGNGHCADIQANRFYGDLSGSASEVNGHTVNADVPEGAKFTDTTYGDATQSEHGLMSPTDKKKLDDLLAKIDMDTYYAKATDLSAYVTTVRLNNELQNIGRELVDNYLTKKAATDTYATIESLKKEIQDMKTYVDQNSAGGVSIDTIYPVGSIYLTMDIKFNPNKSFGGTWEITSEGKALFGADITGQDPDFEVPGMTGGEKTHTLTIDEMPAHNHNVTGTAESKTLTGKVWNFASQGASNGPGNSTSGICSKGGDANSFYPATTKTATGVADGFTINASHSHTVTAKAGSVGGGTAHNNLPPYQTIVVWKRTA